MASVNGLLFTQDRVAVTQGRMSSPARPDEIVMAPQVAKQFGFHVGQVIPYGFYSNAQQSLPGFGTKAVAPALRADLKLVGLASLNSEIVEDDVDILPTFIPLTPAFARELLAQKGEQFTGALIFGIQTKGGAATVPAVEREVSRSHSDRRDRHGPCIGSGRGQGGSLAEADLHRARCLRWHRAPRRAADRRPADGASVPGGSW